MRTVAITLSVVVLLVAGLAAPSPASAVRRGPCVAGNPDGPKCLVWRARVKWAADGDTVKPRIWQNGRWSEKRNVRMTGIQAPELRDYSRRSRSGECMSVNAAEELDRLVHGRVFRLVSMQRTVGGGDRGRLRRSLQVRRGGRWVDPAMVLLSKGLALWSTDGDEWAWNGIYQRLAADAAASGAGLWNPEACGKPGPSRNSPLRLRVHWNAKGGERPNGEWVRIRNLDPARRVRLRGWRVRDPGLRGSKLKSGYRFPRRAFIPAGGSIRVRVGRGRNRNGAVYHWGFTRPLFQNATYGREQIGDGAYLFDPNDELRAYHQYPCRRPCP